MASPPPPYQSVSRPRPSGDELRSVADDLLRATISRTSSDTVSRPRPRDDKRVPISRSISSSSASVARSHASQNGSQSLGDEMLRASSSRSTSSIPSTAPPSYRSSISSTSSSVLPPSRDRSAVVRPGRKVSVSRPPVVGAVSAPGSVPSSDYSRLSAAEVKDRVRQLEQEVNRAKSQSRHYPTAGLFKASCSTDLLFLIDTTGSMNSYIEAAKKQVESIVKDIKEAFLNEANVRVAVVAYKDHDSSPNIEFLDFASSAAEVRLFLNTLEADGGGDIPEDVLGAIQRAVNASWKQQTRCIVHIADAPPHGRALHDFTEAQDDYYRSGSEPHGLTYEPLLRKLVQLNINYAMLSINNSTDRMSLAFSRIYAATGDIKLLSRNTYYSQMSSSRAKSTLGSIGGTGSVGPRFEESQLGTSYSALRHLVVKCVTSSVSRTANRLSLAMGPVTGGRASNLSAIKESVPKGDCEVNVPLETLPPQWNKPGWLNETLELEGFCPDVVVHSATTLNDMIESDENIKLGVAQLTVRTRSMPFAHGAVRTASYARPVATTSQFVVKSFIEEDAGLADMVEDMRIQAMCKAFALEFNGLVKGPQPIDFVVTMCLQRKSGKASRKGSLSLEPFIEGEYIKYNNNVGFVMNDSPEYPFNQSAQAYSHFTFERSWGLFMVIDLQGVGNLFTDPAIHTRDPERFKLTKNNWNEEGFKFFFAGHECNHICRQLGLKSNREMAMTGNYEFREQWPTMDPTVCCSNKLCRRIIRLANAHVSERYLGHHWCDTCWPQLEATAVTWICIEPGPNHDFEVSKFFYESQAQAPPRKCPDHLEKDKTVSSAAVVGGSLWNRMNSTNHSTYISGRAW